MKQIDPTIDEKDENNSKKKIVNIYDSELINFINRYDTRIKSLEFYDKIIPKINIKNVIELSD
jgi:hypothetical protein